MLNSSGVRTQRRSPRPLSLGEMDCLEPKTKNNLTGKLLLVASLLILAIIVISQSSSFTSPSAFSQREEGVTHVLVTGGAGYIGSHAALRLLRDSYRVTIVDNLSRGNLGAVKTLQQLFPQTGRLQFIYADLGDPLAVEKIFSENAFDAVMHFAAVAYVGESTLYPLKYYHNITSNTLGVLEAMARHKVKKLIYSSTCATYGEPEKMPITEDTPQVPINPYGKAKKMAEDMILDFLKNSDMARDRTVTAKNTKTGQLEVIYKASENIAKLKTPIVENLQEVSESESAVVWGEVSEGIVTNNWEKAREAKRDVEEKQRESLRKRKASGQSWIPKHFSVARTGKDWDCVPLQPTVPRAPIVVPL